MQINVDEKLCKKKKLSMAQMFLLLAIKNSEDVQKELEELASREILVQTKDKECTISPPWRDIIDEILVNSTELANEEEYFEALAEEYAKTFPQGKMPGTAYYYRCNKRELVLKFKKFFMIYTEYKPNKETKERIITAAKRYNAEKDADPKYRVLSKYFILKNKQVMDENGVMHIEEVSPLATYLENEKEENVINNDWLNISRN